MNIEEKSYFVKISHYFIGKLKGNSTDIPQISVLDAALFCIFLYN